MVRGRLTITLVVLVAVVTPPALVVTGFRVLAHDWFVRYEYDRSGFPADRLGLAPADRERLALVGLAAIQPSSDGIVLLERATLPGGQRAFDHREVSHMRDVRLLLARAFRLQAVAVAAIVVVAWLTRRGSARRAVPLGLAIGSALTLAAAALAVPIILLGFDSFFVGFHELFFSGDTWRFSRTDTLLRLYPERFWEDTSRLIAVIAVAQAALLAPLAAWWARRAGRTEPA